MTAWPVSPCGTLARIPGRCHTYALATRAVSSRLSGRPLFTLNDGGHTLACGDCATVIELGARGGVSESGIRRRGLTRRGLIAHSYRFQKRPNHPTRRRQRRVRMPPCGSG